MLLFLFICFNSGNNRRIFKKIIEEIHDVEKKYNKADLKPQP